MAREALAAAGRSAGFGPGEFPLAQRIPKLKGFKNPFRVEYNVINLDTLQEFDGEIVSPETLRARGLVHKHGLVKVLGRGELSRRLDVSAHAFSKSAQAAIEGAGGRITVLAPAEHGAAWGWVPGACFGLGTTAVQAVAGLLQKPVS